MATDHGLASISFPSISTGAYRFPLDEATQIAMRAVAGFLKVRSASLKEVVFVLYDATSHRAYSWALGEISRSL